MREPQRPWSLRRRVAVTFGVLATAPVLVATFVGVAWLDRSIHNELEALAREELEELHASMKTDAADPVDLAAVASRLSGDHPEVQMAWRLTDLRRERTVRTHGTDELLATLADAPPGFTSQYEMRDVGRGLIVASLRFDDRVGATLVLDGTRQVAQVDRYWVVGLATAGIALLLGIACADLLSRRLRALLGEVADDLREPDEGRPRSALPVELEPIAAELRGMLDEVSRRASDAKVFTAGLAHELRSPLQNLIGEAEVALMRAREPESYRDLLERQLQELHEFARAVDNLLHVCSTDEPERPRHRELFSLQDELELRLQAERSQARARGVTLHIEARGDTAIEADREAIARAVRNLVNNAIKWSPDGGEVRVEATRDGDDVHLDVHDAGPGVPAAERDRVFTPFAQGPAPRGARAGFGLGLAITKAAVTEHGGAITIGTSPLGGARFRVTLPGADPARASRASSA